MAPKKDAGKAQGSSTKVAVDKASIRPPPTFQPPADRPHFRPLKKGGAAQKQIKTIQSQAADAKTPEQKRKDAEKTAREREKAASEAAKRETAELFKPVQVQKVPFGVDPKTVLCQFYKQGSCDKGKKCKFSHDLDVGRKSEKRNLYTDTREENEEEEEKRKDDMAGWDEEKLRLVVMSKHGNPKTTTDKVCKFFIEAVEIGKYGWFWGCPNGGDKCMYRHSLPPGFILQTHTQRLAERALLEKSPLQTLTLEDFLETSRQALTGTLTPVTPESFATWKKERLDKKAAEEEARKAKEATGRAMFEQGGWESGEDSEEDSEEGESGEGEGEGEGEEGWDVEGMRRETERVRGEEERRRVEGLGGQGAVEGNGVHGVHGDEAVGLVSSNGVNGHT